jgi:hypothetical protein
MDLVTSSQQGSAVLGVPRRHGSEENMFKYKPLDTSVDSIRLLILHGAPSQDSALSCSLYHTNFAESPHYDALSYEWGSPASTKPLKIEGARLLIGENLHEALVHLREEEDYTLWIDAICINQDDLAEKQYQVGLMDFIYHRAEGVLVWLGLPPPNLIIPNRPNLIIPDNKYPILSERHLETFYTWSWNHTYWSRVWIVQEIALARNLTVCIGKHYLSWARYLATLQNHHLFSCKGDKIQKLDEKRNGRHGPSNRLEQLLADFQHAQCSETKDKIYGFLGLAHDCPPELRPDYSKSLFDIYAEVLNAFSQLRTLPDGRKNTVDRMMKVVGYSQLVQGLLSPVIPHGPSSARSTDYQSHSIRARGAITHRIIHLGPPRDRIVASSAANKQWRDSFATYFSLPQVIQSLRESNEAYFPVIEEMRCETRRKYRVFNPHQMHSRGTLAACPWTNNERMWSHLGVHKVTRQRAIETEFAKDFETALKRAFTASTKIEIMSRQSDITARSRSRPRSRPRRISHSSSHYSGRVPSHSRLRSPLKLRSRFDLTSGSVPRSMSPHPDVMAAIRNVLLDSSKGLLGFNQRIRTRTRPQERGRVRGSSPSSVYGRCPSNDLSLISFAESPRTPCEPRLFLSDKGIIGLAPPETELGDIICQFWATDVTAVLREEPSSRSLANDAMVIDERPERNSTEGEAPEKPSVDNTVDEPTKSEAAESEVTEQWVSESDDTQSEVRQSESIYRIIGRAHLSTGYLENLEPTYHKWNEPPEDSECIDITMSIHTLAHLTS